MQQIKLVYLSKEIHSFQSFFLNLEEIYLHAVSVIVLQTLKFIAGALFPILRICSKNLLIKESHQNNRQMYAIILIEAISADW